MNSSLIPLRNSSGNSQGIPLSSLLPVGGRGKEFGRENENRTELDVAISETANRSVVLDVIVPLTETTAFLDTLEDARAEGTTWQRTRTGYAITAVLPRWDVRTMTMAEALDRLDAHRVDRPELAMT